MTGQIYLIPNLLGITPPEAVLPAKTIEIASQLTYFLVENAKASRAFLKTLPLSRTIAELFLQELPKTATNKTLRELLTPLSHGWDIGILSDAGCPGIADPGAHIVAAAHSMGIKVTPLVGPSSILLALMAAGLEGQRFAFHGYLPIKPLEREQALKGLESRSQQHHETQIFIETPYRNNALLDAILTTCTPQTLLCVAANLTTIEERIQTYPIQKWRQQKPCLDRQPTIFLLLS